jgi:hypothetical protein
MVSALMVSALMIREVKEYQDGEVYSDIRFTKLAQLVSIGLLFMFVVEAGDTGS